MSLPSPRPDIWADSEPEEIAGAKGTHAAAAAQNTNTYDTYVFYA